MGDPGFKFCRPKCNSGGYYWSGREKNECLKCTDLTPLCERCQDLTGFCTGCPDDFDVFKVSETKFECRLHCLKEEFIEIVKINGVEKQECTGCSQNVLSGKGCVGCQDFTGECEECGSNYFLNNQKFCQKKCSKGEYWTGNLINSCTSCVKEHENCALCSNETGICQKCEEGYWLNSTFCQKRCASSKMYYIRQDNRCSFCSPGCARCLNETSRCLGCDLGYRFLESASTCRKIAGESLAEYNGLFFDKVEFAVCIVFNKELNEDSLPQLFDQSRIEMLDTVDRGVQKGDQESDGQVVTELKLVKREFRKNRLILKFEFPSEEVDRKSLRIISEPATIQGVDKRKREDDKKTRILEGESEAEQNRKVEILENISYYSPSTGRDFYYRFGVLLVMVGLLVSVGSLIADSKGTLVAVAQFTQLMYLVRLLEVDFPLSVELLLQGFDKSIFQLIPGGGLFGISGENECEMDLRFFKAGMDCSSFGKEMLRLMVLLGALVGTKVIIWMTFKCFFENPKRIARRLKYLKENNIKKGAGEGKVESKARVTMKAIFKWVDWSLTLSCILGAQVRVLADALLTIRFLSLKSFMSLVVYLLALFILTAYLILFGSSICVSILLFTVKSNEKDKPNETNPLKTGNKKSKMSKILKGCIEVLEGVDSLTWILLTNWIATVLVILLKDLIFIKAGTIVLTLLIQMIFSFFKKDKTIVEKSASGVKEAGLIIVFIISGLSNMSILSSTTEKMRYQLLGILVLLVSLAILISVSTLLGLDSKKKMDERKQGALNRERASFEKKAQIPDENATANRMAMSRASMITTSGIQKSGSLAFSRFATINQQGKVSMNQKGGKAKQAKIDLSIKQHPLDKFGPFHS